MVVPQLSQESRNYIVGLTMEQENVNTTRMCLDMVKVSVFFKGYNPINLATNWYLMNIPCIHINPLDHELIHIFD